ncbi:hypothetical protein ACTPOE_16870 [Castellaniella sp. WN]
MNTETIEVEVLDPEKPIAAYNPIRAGIQAMQDKYGKTVFSVATTKDMEATKAARAEVREVRYNVEKIRKALKAPALAYSKRIDDEAKEYTEAIMAIEAPIDELIKAEERRKAEEKAERERIEAERQQQVQGAIDAIKDGAVSHAGCSSQQLAAAIDVYESVEITLERFGDRAGEAAIAKQQTLTKLQDMRAAVLAQEAEAKRLADEREALDQQRREQEEREAQARAKAAAEEVERKAAIERQQAEMKAQQDEIDRQRREIEEAKAAAAKAEQDRLDTIAAEEQAKRDAAAKAAQDKADAEAAAAKRKADEEAAEAARRERVQFEQNGPGAQAIIGTLAQHYRVHESSVIKWLLAIDLDAASKELLKEFA